MNRRLLATVSKSQSSPRILAGVILKRNPIVLRDPTSFEKAYADYRREFTQETSAPYNSDYFEAELRNGPSKSSKSKSSSSASTAVGEESKVKYMERDGDDTDQSRLDRLMSRSLYLTVREGVAGKWVFPCSPVEGEESLVEAARRSLRQQFGEEMGVWFVGNAPVGYHGSSDEKTSCDKIFSGQAHPGSGVKFAWLTKQELGEYMDSSYYQAVKDCLTDN